MASLPIFPALCPPEYLTLLANLSQYRIFLLGHLELTARNRKASGPHLQLEQTETRQRRHWQHPINHPWCDCLRRELRNCVVRLRTYTRYQSQLQIQRQSRSSTAETKPKQTAWEKLIVVNLILFRLRLAGVIEMWRPWILSIVANKIRPGQAFSKAHYGWGGAHTCRTFHSLFLQVIIKSAFQEFLNFLIRVYKKYIIVMIDFCLIEQKRSGETKQMLASPKHHRVFAWKLISA